MLGSLEILVGLLDHNEAPRVAAEDFDGEHGPALRAWQDLGFLSREPGVNPAAGCPHCGEGVPYRLGDLFRCSKCVSVVDPRHFQLWEFSPVAFLRWLAGKWRLKGKVRRIEDRLWQLGTREATDGALECFYRKPGFLSSTEAIRLGAYQRSIVLHGLSLPQETGRETGRRFCILEILQWDGCLRVADLDTFLFTGQRRVRFDADSGALWIGDRCLGEVPLHSKEYFFLDCLAESIDRFVAYADLKRFVLRRSGSLDSRDEATFCHRLKSRIKKQWIPEIDRLLATTNKGDGYRLRGWVEQ
jgi:hypothetical protein